MSLTATELGHVISALDRALQGTVVRGVSTPRATGRIAVELFGGGETCWLEVVIESGVSRICRTSPRPLSAEAPHPFAMLLRRELIGLAFQSARQIGGDRACVLEFARGGSRGSLVCELTSRHGNLFWLDAGGIIRGSFHPNRSFKRRLVPGEPYAPPIPRPGGDSAACRFAPGDRIDREVDAHYRDEEAHRARERLREEVRSLARGALARLERIAGKLDGDRARAEAGEKAAALGHLLKANLSRASRGDGRLVVKDFEGRPTEIPLDPRLGPVENMERLFGLARRGRRALPVIAARRARIDAEIAGLRSRLAETETEDPEQLAAIAEALRADRVVAGHRPRAQGRRAGERLPYREYAIAAGRSARVGRSARDNDALTTRHARPDDLWLHVRGARGSHVVVPMGRGEDPAPEILIDAAHLAAHFSEERAATDVEVVYTRRRYVQKPRGAEPGSVRLLREKSLALRVEPERLARLLGP